jgi:Tol biopolymer transport system component
LESIKDNTEEKLMKNIKHLIVFAVTAAALASIILPTVGVRSSMALDLFYYLPIVLTDSSIPIHEDKIAFSGGPGTTFELYTIHPDGSGLSQVTTLNDDIESISWSPDGNTLLFVAELANRDVYTVSQDGSNLQQLTNNAFQEFCPDWSSDGSQIAFSSNRSGSYEIYKMDADGADVVKLSSLPITTGCPLWSPDGSTIAFSAGAGTSREIYRMNPDGSNLLQITTNSASDIPYKWSPDSSKMLIWSTRYGKPDLIIIDLNDTEIVNLSPYYNPWSAAFSPDGTQVVYSIDAGAWWQTYILTLDGSDPVTLECDGSPFKSSFLDWEPNGDRIVYSTDPTSALKVLDMTIGTCTQIASGLHGIEPSWRP